MIEDNRNHFKWEMEFLKILWDANRTECIKFGEDSYKIKAIYAD